MASVSASCLGSLVVRDTDGIGSAAVGDTFSGNAGILFSGIYAVFRAALSTGGKDGNDLSRCELLFAFCLCPVLFRDVFFLLLAINASWQSMQNMPCDVLAYLRFSIFRLQFLHLKQFAQKAWSPVKMARSSILFPQLLQLYVQLLHINEPSPSKSRLASESRRVPHVLQRKQSICHLFPAAHIISTLLQPNHEPLTKFECFALLEDLLYGLA